MRAGLSLAVLLVAAPVARCAQKTPPRGRPPTAPRGCHQHVGLAPPNSLELAHAPLGIPAFGNVSAGGYFCGGAATTAEGRRLTVISSYDTSVAFVVVDSTDPVHPKHLGDYVLDFEQTYDVDVTPDGKHVVIAVRLLEVEDV